MTDQDSVLVNQLALHRGLHSLARPLLAILRDLLLKAQLQAEVNQEPPNLDVATALEALDRWNELAEKVDMEQRSWT